MDSLPNRLFKLGPRSVTLSIRWSHTGYVTIVCSAYRWDSDTAVSKRLDGLPPMTEEELAQVCEDLATAALRDA